MSESRLIVMVPLAKLNQLIRDQEGISGGATVEFAWTDPTLPDALLLRVYEPFKTARKPWHIPNTVTKRVE